MEETMDSDVKVRESDVRAYAEKARRTVDELANEARSLGQDGAEMLRDILSETGNELNNFLQNAKGVAGSLVGGVKGAVDQGKSTLEEAFGQKKS
jgi:gamma-glutamyl:cysteine ligase YbdK (ATP-grasp superfamily)